MLYEIYKEKMESLTKIGMFDMYPKCANRDAWDSIDIDLKHHIIKEAEEYLGYEWPRMKATDYLDYYREGSRASFDKIFKMNFDALTKLTLGECAEGEGRFIDDIANGVYARCEETSWVHTGHLQHHGDEQIPLYTGKYLDLRSCSMGSQLAHVYYLLKSELDNISPYLCKRIEHEIKVRILDNYIENDHWWMNLTPDGIVNNWNTHCNKNVMRTALIMETNPDRLKKIMSKICRSLDVFLSIHEEDGACNEGPGYWKGAGFSFLNILVFISEIYQIPIETFLDDRIRNMASYLYKVFIHDDYYMSYADGNGRNPMYDIKLYLTSKALSDVKLQDLSIDVFQKHQSLDIFYDHFIYILFDYLEYVMNYKDMKTSSNKASDKRYYLKEAALNNAHIFAARQNEGNEKGFFAGLKGGHNNESHNHNDIGAFYIFYDGLPVVIDAGAGMYTIKTFSPERYDIWTMQSIWHSLPVINGHMQSDGVEYKSKSFKVTSKDEISWASMEISDAYSEKTEIKSFNRKIILNRVNKSVALFDEINMINSENEIVLYMTVLYNPEITDTGDILLSNGDNTIYLDYDKNLLKPFSEVKDVSNDKKLRESWGDSIYRLGFTVIESKQKNVFEFTFKILSEGNNE